MQFSIPPLSLIHLVVESLGKPVEIQLRTELQHLWAELSEKLSDLYEPSVKYGVGSETALRLLSAVALPVIAIERYELDLLRIKNDIGDAVTDKGRAEMVLERARKLEQELESDRNTARNELNDIIKEIASLRGAERK